MILSSLKNLLQRAGWAVLLPISMVVLFPYAASGQTNTPAKTLTSPGFKASLLQFEDHRISPLDIIHIDVFNELVLSKDFRVSASGKISFPPIEGEIEVKDKTPIEVESDIKEKLAKDYLVDPQVTVTVKEYRNKSVIVLGEVKNQGLIPLPGEIKWTILNAIAQAGGTTRLAKDVVEFTRRGKVQKFSMKELKKMNEQQQIILEPNDTIFVPASWY